MEDDLPPSRDWNDQLAVLTRWLRARARWLVPGLSADVDDLVQETLIAVHANPALRRFEQKELRAFAHVVLRRRITDTFRKRSIMGGHAHFLDPTDGAIPPEVFVDLPQRQLLRAWQVAMDRLSPADRELLSASLEIDARGSPEVKATRRAAERKRLQRARERFRLELRRELPADFDLGDLSRD